MYKGDRQISAADLLPVRKLSRKDSNDLVLCQIIYFIVLIGDEYERLYDDFMIDKSLILIFRWQVYIGISNLHTAPGNLVHPGEGTTAGDIHGHLAMLRLEFFLGRFQQRQQRRRAGSCDLSTELTARTPCRFLP